MTFGMGAAAILVADSTGTDREREQASSIKLFNEAQRGQLTGHFQWILVQRGCWKLTSLKCGHFKRTRLYSGGSIYALILAARFSQIDKSVAALF